MARPDNEYALSGFARLRRATRILLKVLGWSFREEEALRLELLGIALLGPLGFYLGQTAVERALLIMPLFLLLVVELLNTGIETTVDRIGPEHHELSGLAKDLGSAAVGVTLIWGVVTWVIVLV